MICSLKKYFLQKDILSYFLLLQVLESHSLFQNNSFPDCNKKYRTDVSCFRSQSFFILLFYFALSYFSIFFDVLIVAGWWCSVGLPVRVSTISGWEWM